MNSWRGLRAALHRRKQLVRELGELRHEVSRLRESRRLLDRPGAAGKLAEELRGAREERGRLEAMWQQAETVKKRYLRMTQELSTEVATLRFLNYTLSEENKCLNMNLAGEQGHTHSLEQKIRILESRTENRPANESPR